MTTTATTSLDRFLDQHVHSVCIENKTIGKVIGILNVLGSGFFGTTYKACYPISTYQRQRKKKFLIFTQYKQRMTCDDPHAITIAIKKQGLYDQDKLFTETTLSRQCFQKESPFWIEYISTKLASELVSHHICPFFIEYVKPALCVKHSYGLFFMSYYEGTIKELCKRPSTKTEDIVSISLQVLMAFITLFVKLSMVHFDAHVGNILYKTDSSKKNWSFRFFEITYIIPNTGYQVAIADFGLSGIKGSYVSPNPTTYTGNLRLPFQQMSDDDILTVNSMSDCYRFSRSIYRTYPCTFTEQLHQLASMRFKNKEQTVPATLVAFFEDVYQLPAVQDVVQKYKHEAKIKYSLDKPFDKKDVFSFL